MVVRGPVSMMSTGTGDASSVSTSHLGASEDATGTDSTGSTVAKAASAVPGVPIAALARSRMGRCATTTDVDLHSCGNALAPRTVDLTRGTAAPPAD